MKIVSFEIRSIRGIRSFGGEPKGSSIVVSGPNGTGKSGVIDAIDFLFSGNIQRLSGPGTKSLTLDQHGKHIDDDLATSYVGAVMQLGNGNSVTIRRTLATKKLELLKGDPKDFDSIRAMFASGQFQLTRRELLRFIVAEGSTRAEEIQELLDVSDLDKMRSDLNAVVRRFTKDAEAAKQTRDRVLAEIDFILQTTDSSKRRARVNEFRALLGKEPITDWSKSTNIAVGLEQPESKDASALKRKEFRQALDALQLANYVPPIQPGGESSINALLAVIAELSTIENKKATLEQYELLRLGIAQVPDNGSCPLCDTSWNRHDLIEHIKAKLALSEKLKSLADRFDSLSGLLLQQIDHYIAKVSITRGHAKKIADALLEAALQSCLDELSAKRKVFSDIERLVDIQKLLEVDKGHLATAGLAPALDLGAAAATALPEESPEELAYKTLLTISTLFKTFLESVHTLGELEKKKGVAIRTQDAYERARKSLFENLYAEVENDFKDYYVALNEDEATFKAKLHDKGSSVDLTVDFYGRGMFPPIALHSEGHQDSMGVCLYLALMKRLKSEGFTIAMLDDVMMSIDVGHRRRLCQLLKDRFPQTQFIITTHDRVWARQLKEFQIVKQANLFQFRTWSLESGPVVETKDAYEAARDHANKNDIVSAASHLRNNLELELQEVCALLKAKVVFHESLQWNPGELRDAAIGQFNELLKRAKSAANSWNNSEGMKKLDALGARLKDRIAASKSDDWQINAAVHYNAWGQFTKEEMLATVDGIEGLVAAFCCEHCGSKFYLTYQGPTASNLTCRCGQTTHTLIPKS